MKKRVLCERSTFRGPRHLRQLFQRARNELKTKAPQSLIIGQGKSGTCPSESARIQQRRIVAVLCVEEQRDKKRRTDRDHRAVENKDGGIPHTQQLRRVACSENVRTTGTVGRGVMYLAIQTVSPFFMPVSTSPKKKSISDNLSSLSAQKQPASAAVDSLKQQKKTEFFKVDFLFFRKRTFSFF